MKRWGLIAAAGVVAAGAGAFALIDPMAGVGAGYVAKVACSEIFLAGRDPVVVQKIDFNDISPVLERVRLNIDQANKSVAASVAGLGRTKAVYRDGYGCTLVRGGAPEKTPPLPPFGRATTLRGGGAPRPITPLPIGVGWRASQPVQ